MEMNYTSLQDQISRANNYYQELCVEYEELLKDSKAVLSELMQVENKINSFYESIAGATKMSNIGASEAIRALQGCVKALNSVYRLLKLDRSFTISAGGVKATRTMIHYAPEMSAKRKKLVQQGQKVLTHSSDIQAHAESLDNQHANDILLYQAKAIQMGADIARIGKNLAEFAAILADAESRYSEAQIRAITRAKRIPIPD